MIITVLALAFTIAAFWWIFLRSGTITTAAPDTYATPPGPTLRLRFPFVLLNTGAIPVVVADLRLIVDGVHEFHWSSVRKKISPSMDDFLDAAASFAIKGRDAVQLFAEFGQVPPEWRPEPGESYPVKLEAKDQSGRWKQVVEFDWWSPVRVDQMTSNVAHRNAAAGGPLL
jgi:hypothetical protein